MEKRQIYKKLSKQARIDAEMHRLVKIQASIAGVSIKTLLEGYVVEGLDKDKRSNK